MVHRFTAEGKLPSFKVGGSRQFKYFDIEKWIEKQNQFMNNEL